MRGEPVFDCPKDRPSIIDKINDPGREAKRIKREVHKAVDERDKRQCKCCGRKGNPNSTTAIGRLHRAHIQDASRGGAMETENILLLCWICHGLEHAKQLHIIGTNADKHVTFEIHEAAVVEVFGSRVLPSHVRMIL
jgi:5-methylcytosine-specific restriction endonuclease McrA